MSRLWTAVVLLVAVVGLCWGAAVYQRRQTDALLEQLDTLESVYRRGDLEESRRLAGELADNYTRLTALLPSFISHDELAGPRETVATLAACMEEGNPEEFLLETARLRRQLQWLRQVDSPTWQNVF